MAAGVQQQRRRNGSIASRYLESIQCGGTETTAPTSAPYALARDVRAGGVLLRSYNNDRNAARSNNSNNSSSNSSSIPGSTLGFSCSGGTEGYATASSSSSSPLLPNPFRSPPSRSQPPKSPHRRARAPAASASAYDKITAAGKAADCSRSILTASTAMMQDPSYDDSMSSNSHSNNNNNSNNNNSSNQRTPPRRRRGRSRTPNEAGTNSRGSVMQQQQQQQYQHRQQQLKQQQQEDDLLDELLHGYEHEFEYHDDDDEEHLHRHRQEHEREYEYEYHDDDDEHDLPGTDSSGSDHLHKPGSQSTAPLSSTPSTPNRCRMSYNHPALAAAAAISPRTPPDCYGSGSGSESNIAMDGSASNEDDTSAEEFTIRVLALPSEHSSSSNSNGSSSSPTRVLPPRSATNPRLPSDSPGPQPKSPGQTRLNWRVRQIRRKQQLEDLQLQLQLQPSPPQQQQQEQELSDSSEAEAPTEIIANGDTCSKVPYPLSRSSRTLPSPNSNTNSNHNHIHKHIINQHKHNDLLSRVRNRFHNDEDDMLLPSLLDASSSSVSSASLPVAKDSPLPLPNHTTSKLALHVESARMQSILSSSCGSETTATTSLDNTNPNISSLNAEPGGGTKSNSNSISMLDSIPRLEAAPSPDEAAGAAAPKSLLRAEDSESEDSEHDGVGGDADPLGPRQQRLQQRQQQQQQQQQQKQQQQKQQQQKQQQQKQQQQKQQQQKQQKQQQQNQQQQQRAATRSAGGLRRRPSGAQVAMLAAHYRRGNLTARGAQPQQQQQQQQQPTPPQETQQGPDPNPNQNHAENNDAEEADPILSLSYSQSTSHVIADSVPSTPGSQSTLRGVGLRHPSLNMSYSQSTSQIVTDSVLHTPGSQSTLRGLRNSSLNMSYSHSTAQVVPDPILSLSLSQSTANHNLHTPNSQATSRIVRQAIPNLPQVPRLRNPNRNQREAAPRDEDSETDRPDVFDDKDSDDSTLLEYESYDSDEDDQQDGEEVSRGRSSTRAQEFVSYNERSSPNTADVFQSRGASPSTLARGEKTQETKPKPARSLSRGRDRRGKSPIQPLFSSHRLDESNNTSIRESSIRSRSLGRATAAMSRSTMPAKPPRESRGRPGIDPGNKPPLRRSKSVSQSLERKTFPSPVEASRVQPRATSRERQGVSQERSFGNRGDEEDEELVDILERAGREIERRSANGHSHSLQESRSKSPPSSSTPGAGSASAWTPRQREPSPGWRQEPSKPTDSPGFRKGSTKDVQSIKNKIRAYNLKRSPRSVRVFNLAESPRVPSSITQWGTGYSSSSRSTDYLERSSQSRSSHTQSGHSGKSLTKQTQEEKKEDDRTRRGASNHSDLDSLRERLQRRFVEAQYFGEETNDGSATTSTNDEFSVQSLREHFERQNAEQVDDEEDDPSVRSLREMFEPPSNRQSIEAFSSLRARFEPKSRANRLSFVPAQNDSTRRMPTFKPMHSRLNDWSVRHLSGRNLGPGQMGDSSRDRTIPNRSEETRGYPSRASHARGEEIDSTSRDDLAASRIPGSRSSPKDETRTSHENALTRKDMKGASTDSEFSAAVTLDPSYAEVSLLSNPHLPKSPGDNIDRKDTKESSMESEFSDAVTLDPSYAEVSLLTNPSPIRTTSRVKENIPAILKGQNQRVPGAHWTAQGKPRSNIAEHELTTKDTKESSTDSEFSDAVTLDPSYAEVSLLTNPSPIRSLPEPDRVSDVSTSLLLDLATRVPERSDPFSKANIPKSRILNRGNREEETSDESSSHDSESSYEEDASHSSADSSTANSGRRFGALQNPSSRHKADSQCEPVLSMPVHDRGFDSFDRSRRSTDGARDNRDSSQRSPRSLENSRMVVDSSERSSRSMSSTRDALESPHRSPRSAGSARVPLGISSIESPQQLVFESSSRSSRSEDNPIVRIESSNRSNKSGNSSRHTVRSSERSGRYLEASYREVEPSNDSKTSRRSMERSYREVESSNPLNRSIDGSRQAHESSENSSRSTDKTRAVVDMSVLRSTGSQGSPSADKPRHWPFQKHLKSSNDGLDRPLLQQDQDPSHEERQSPNQSHSTRDPAGLRATPPVSKQESVPPMPSPFDENYAAIMESRHKMLLSRQRTLLNRRANREKLQNSQKQQQQQQKQQMHQPGFFGKTNPKSPPRGNEYVGLSDEDEVTNHSKQGDSDTGGKSSSNHDRSSSNHSRGPEKPSRRPNGFWTANDRTSYGLLPDPPNERGHSQRRPKTTSSDGTHQHQHQHQHQATTPVVRKNAEDSAPHRRVTSILSRIRPAFHLGASALSPSPSTSTSSSSSSSSHNKRADIKHDSQKQAVLDRLSAVRAARMRRNHAYGDARNNNNNNNNNAGSSYRMSRPQPSLDTIHDSTTLDYTDATPLVPTPGYRYYPHNNTSMDVPTRNRDDDQSFATNESNAQEYAANLAVD